MELILKEAKNGSKTFLINSLYYHSAYDPQKEALRFVDSLDFSYIPKYLFIIEAGFNYCYEYLKDKFPNTKIINIKIIQNKLLPLKDDEVFYTNFSDYLLTIEPTLLLNSQIVSWPCATKLFEQEIKEISKHFLSSLELSKTVLITKQVFEKKWLRNSINFLTKINTLNKINIIDQNILIVASGPTLENCINIIKKNNNKFFIVALSSAINVLIKNKIIPDLCISCDGGFWAKKHLYPLIKNNIPLALAIEGAVPNKLFKQNTIIPLVYEQGLSSILYKKIDLPYMRAKSYSTVSQTAIEFCRTLTTKKIFILGLDLSTKKGLPHARPNILEIEDSILDNKISSQSKRICLRENNSKLSLNTYHTAFLQNNYTNCYRIIDSSITTKIPSMNEISCNDFEKILQNENSISKDNFITQIKKISKEEKIKILKTIKYFIKENSNTQDFKSSLFPLDYTILDHLQGDEKTNKITEINNKNKEFVSSLQKLLNE